MKIILTIIFIWAGLLNLYAGQWQLVPYGEAIESGRGHPITHQFYEKDGKIFLLNLLTHPYIIDGEDGVGAPVYKQHYGISATIFDTITKKTIFKIREVDSSENFRSKIPTLMYLDENNEVTILSNYPKKYIPVPALRGYRLNLKRYSLELTPELKYDYLEEKDTVCIDSNGKERQTTGAYAYYPAVYDGNEYLSALNSFEDNSNWLLSKHDKDGKLIGKALSKGFYKQTTLTDTTYLRGNFMIYADGHDFVRDGYLYVNARCHERLYTPSTISTGGTTTRRNVTTLLKVVPAPDAQILWSCLVNTDSSYGIGGRFKISEYEEASGKHICYAACREEFLDNREESDLEHHYYCIAEVDYSTGELLNYIPFQTDWRFELQLKSVHKTASGDFEFAAVTKTYPTAPYTKLIGRLSRDGKITTLDTIVGLGSDDEWSLDGYMYSPSGNYIVMHKDNADSTKTSQLYQVTPLGAIPEPAIIKNYSLFPNPASDDCTLSMDMTEAGSVSISLSDMLGRNIMQIYDGYAEAGIFTKTFDTKHLASGVYSVIIRIGDKAKAEKLIINR